MQLEYDCIHHRAVRNKRQCSCNTVVLTVQVHCVWLQCSVLVCQWIVIVTLTIVTIGQHDVDNSLLSPILVWIWDERVFLRGV